MKDEREFNTYNASYNQHKSKFNVNFYVIVMDSKQECNNNHAYATYIKTKL